MQTHPDCVEKLPCHLYCTYAPLTSWPWFHQKSYLFSPHYLPYALFTFWVREPARHQAISCFLTALDWSVCVAVAAVVHRSERAGCNQSCL